MVNLFDMSLGMIIGMALAPIMMRIAKKLIQRYRFNKIMKDLINSKRKDNDLTKI